MEYEISSPWFKLWPQLCVMTFFFLPEERKKKPAKFTLLYKCLAIVHPFPINSIHI